MTFRLVTDTSALMVKTDSLASEGLMDLQVRVRTVALLPAAEELVHRVVEYQKQTGQMIRPGESMNHGYWTVKFEASKPGTLEVYEYCTVEGEPDWIPGAERTLSYWQGQKELCDSLSAAFAPPHGSQWAFVSKGFLEGVLPLEGQRWKTEAPDSGWIFTTDHYDGNIKSLKQVHLYHVTEAHPKLYKIVGLPPGYGFRITKDGKGSGIWFKPEAV